MSEDIVRVLRIVEYTGRRSVVEGCMDALRTILDNTDWSEK